MIQKAAFAFVLIATVGEQLQETQKIRLQWQSLNGSEIVGHIPRKISRNDTETSRNLLYNDRLLQMTLGLFYVLFSTNTKIFMRKNFRELVQTREKCENLHPAKLTGYTAVAFWQSGEWKETLTMLLVCVKLNKISLLCELKQLYKCLPVWLCVGVRCH